MSKEASRRSVDVAIVGAGTAGLTAYRAAVATAARVVLIESGPPGTMCARVGCMPSKLLLAAADVAHNARHASRFGVDCSVKVNGRAVMERVHRERDRFVDLNAMATARIPVEHKLVGRASFVAPGILAINGQTLEARAVVIATGSTPQVASGFAGLGDRLVVSDDLFAWKDLPESVAVVGTGGIGLELGQALHRLGVRVRMFGRHGRVGPLTDPIVRAAAEQVLRSELSVDFDAKVRGATRTGDRVTVQVEGQAADGCVETFMFALIATGRRPSLDDLCLENAGVVLDSNGVPLFDRTTLQCGSAPVFIAGDASRDLLVQHEAADEGKLAGENAARYPNVQARPRRSSLQLTFCDPQIAVVGSSFDELSDRGNFVIGEVSFDDQGRSRIMGQNRGVARLYADPASGRFLGAEVVGPRAEHLGHLLAWAHQQRLTLDQMLAMPFYHPVVEEGLRTALKDARAKLNARPSQDMS